MREAITLVERVELEVPDEDELVVVGFRENGCGCIYFGPQPVYQFNSPGQFRRGFVDDGRGQHDPNGSRLGQLGHQVFE